MLFQLVCSLCLMSEYELVIQKGDGSGNHPVPEKMRELLETGGMDIYIVLIYYARFDLCYGELIRTFVSIIYNLPFVHFNTFAPS